MGCARHGAHHLSHASVCTRVARMHPSGQCMLMLRGLLGRLGAKRRCGIRRPSLEHSPKRPFPGLPRRATPAWSVMYAGSALCSVRPWALTQDCDGTAQQPFVTAAAMLLLIVLAPAGEYQRTVLAFFFTWWRTTPRCGSMCACAWRAPTWTPVMQGHASKAAVGRTTTCATSAILRRRRGATTPTAAAPVTAPRPRPRTCCLAGAASGAAQSRGDLVQRKCRWFSNLDHQTHLRCWSQSVLPHSHVD